MPGRLDTLALAQRLGALALSEQRYRALAETTSAVLWKANADGLAPEGTASWSAYTGQRSDEHTGLGWLDAVHPEDRERTRARWLHSVRHRTPYEVEYRLRRRDGSWANVISRGVPLWDEDGSVREWFGSLQDVTTLREAEAKLRAQERLAAIGELSAAVAHEVRNPLGAIFNALTVLRREVQHPLLAVVSEESDRLNRIVSDLLDFARPCEPTHALETVEKVVQQALSSVDLQSRPVTLQLELDPSVGAFPMDARLVRQLLINLLENALQAMPGGGTLTVRTAHAEAGLVLAVVDSGPGVPDALRDRIFDPFFTTKAMGTGLGLAVVKRIAEGHGGSVELIRAPGACEFRVRLPAPRSFQAPPQLQ